jgi:succinate dehydrogenase / fumarate reductase iron-sulfur subunit
MVINGKERLACKTLVRDVLPERGKPIHLEPLRTLPVQRDLMVDQGPFFANYVKVKPFLMNAEPAPERERLQMPDDHSRIEDASNCILCAACYSACPVLQQKPNGFIGPAATVQAARFNDDSRDRGFEARLPVLDRPDGVWACEGHFECTRVCPRGIKVTKLINLTKRRISQLRPQD